MAAVFVPPSPQTSFAMSTRRPPLANVPNAANSPHHGGNAAVKRARTGSHVDLNLYGQPPSKKQMVDREDMATHSPVKTRTIISQNAESKVFSRRTNNAQATAFEKKLIAARDKDRQPQLRKYEKVTAESLDNIKQWQRHYRKAFPGFVFYFDSIPADVRSRSLREVAALGAREERFFSRTVTHVVTSRPIPEPDAPSPTESPTLEEPPVDGPLQTVNPSLLEKNDHRRDQGNNTDVLYRARQMGMKIWAIEKLQRMLAAIHETDPPLPYQTGRAGFSTTKARGDTELSQVLRNERLHGPSDRDPSHLLKDLVLFKGPYIYIHDMDEKTRPVMVREYQKVAKRQDGSWPQFRSAPLGKCPFIEEAPSRKEIARMREERKRAALQSAIKVDKSDKKTQQQETHEQDNSHQQENANIVPVKEDVVVSTREQTEQDEPPKIFAAPGSPRKSSEGFIAPTLTRTGSFHLGREPAASGVQPSNITSAIRSQMMSSTAAAPGAKAGLSKEVHELKRKVLEKSNGNIINSTNISSQRPLDMLVNLKPMPIMPSRSKRPAEKISHVHEEDTTQSEDNGGTKSRVRDCVGLEQKKVREKIRDPKPGYCENCRDKFEDFDEHVMTRKHRKFATTLSNWSELDALLAKLERPIKH
ncbi:putative G1/S regulator NimO [Talaromyces proteolyticus]|uniref:G1/S regulator NimO n=1 Tax=Talaromyces proteolyticus TaxID=1131652 RepID=A0AAD4L6N7_9EURO|nr:putative G1/S regulator NimO [Talaromyces proteolyticus]KAH8704929.1 putative G1/S regulator NimO [Talaromyces proteolyticus]